MTYAKYVTLCALFAQTDAKLQIEIDQDKIQRVGMDFIGWVGGQAQNAGNLRVAKDLNTVAHKAQLRIDFKQAQIFGPVTDNWRTYLKFLNSSNENCDERGFISCAINTDQGIFDTDNEYSCGLAYQCQTSFSVLDQDDSQEITDKLGKNFEESKRQMDKVGAKIQADLMKAFEKNAQQIMNTAQQAQQKIRQVLKEWGCDSTCVDQCTASPSAFKESEGCSQCSCPAPFQIRDTASESHNFYQYQFTEPAYNVHRYHGYHGKHGYQGHNFEHDHEPNHIYHYHHYDQPSYHHQYNPNNYNYHHHHHDRVVHVHHYGQHSWASDENTTNLYSSGEEDPSNNFYHYGYAGHNQYGPMPMGRYNQNESYYGVQNYGPHQYHTYMDAFTVSNLLSSACDHPSLCGIGKATAQTLAGFPGFDVQGPAQNTGAQSSHFPGFDVHGPASNTGAQTLAGFPGFNVHGPADNTGAQSSQFPGFGVHGPASNSGAQSSHFPGFDVHGPADNIGAQVHGMPVMNGMSFNSPPHVDMALFANKDMTKFDEPMNIESCDIPELCPGVGPSMAGAIDDQELTLATCDIPELCPGVGPSMGGFNMGKLSSLSKCTIPELCVVGNDIASLASEEESTHFTEAEIKHFRETQSFYSGIGISNGNKIDGSFIDYQKPYFAFKPVENKSWVSATTVLCSIGLIGAGYVAVTKKHERDEESFQVELA